MYRQAASARSNSELTANTFLAIEVVASKLTAEHEVEALTFLAGRPLHTTIMAGFIRDNGLVSPRNRGTFYGCRNRQGELEGIALIGHATLMETKSDRALQAFAEIARECTTTHLIMAEEERIDEFWGYYNENQNGQEMRRVCREHLLELTWPVEVLEDVPGLRTATLEDLNLVVPVQAQMAFEESGINPLEEDPLGFRERCARRIEQSRSWVSVENGELIFKAEVIADTPEAVYLEGIWVSSENRRKGYGSRCLSQLCRTLLTKSKSIVLFVNGDNNTAQRFYDQAGFRARASYDTIFLM